MKKEFEKAEVEVIEFEEKDDVVTLSSFDAYSDEPIGGDNPLDD